MAFNPANVQYPTSNLQHMFSRHKNDWGYAGQNWNNATAAAFQATVNGFINSAQVVHEGTYRGQDAWLVIEQASPHKCAIIYRPGYQIWSGWNLSDAQFFHANNPPYSLGGGALAIFGGVLESIVRADSHDALEKLTNEFFDTYKAHGHERQDEASEKTLMDLFAVLDNYIPPHEAGFVTANPGQIQDLDEVKQRANHALAVLEKNA